MKTIIKYHIYQKVICGHIDEHQGAEVRLIVLRYWDNFYKIHRELFNTNGYNSFEEAKEAICSYSNINNKKFIIIPEIFLDEDENDEI